MVARRQTLMRAPLLTALTIGAALAVYRMPWLSGLLVYDRQAVLQGQWWRLATAPLVHFSASHLFWDALVFGVAGALAEVMEGRRFRLLCGIAAIAPGLLFLPAAPELVRYGGLSGLATAAAVYLCLCRTRDAAQGRLLWLLLLAIMAVKIIWEARLGAPLFAAAGDTPFRVLPAVHVLGYLGAAAIFFTDRDKLDDARRAVRPA